MRAAREEGLRSDEDSSESNDARGESIDPEAELGESRCQVKTPEKLLQSVPPAAVMNKKTARSFNNILNFEKSNDSKQMQNPICQSSIVPNDGSSNSIAVLPQNILENPSNYPYPGSSSESGNC